MAITKNLIQLTHPTNTATNISINEKITIKFNEDMVSSSLNSSSILLKKVNGQDLDSTYTYENKTKTLTIKPNLPFEMGSDYQLTIKSKTVGPISIIDTQQNLDVVVRFSTEKVDEVVGVNPSIPTDISVVDTTNGKKFSWKSSNDIVSIKIADSKELYADNVWPESGEIEIKEEFISIPFDLNSGDYFLWIRGGIKAGEETKYSDYAVFPFSISKKETQLEQVQNFNLEIIKTYPEDKQIVKDLEKIIILFKDEVDIKQLTSESIQVNESDVDPIIANILGIKSMTLELDEQILSLEKSKHLIYKLSEGNVFEKGKKYSIVLNKNISAFGDSFVTLGKNKEITFTSQWEHFYVSVESVRNALGSFSEYYFDETIANMIAEVSTTMYKRFSLKETFNPSTWETDMPYFIPLYIQYKVAYRLVLNNVVKSATGMGNTIKLGDLQVAESSVNSTEITDLLGLLKEELDKWEELLENEDKTVKYAGVSFAQKASSAQAYPDYFTRTPFTDLG